VDERAIANYVLTGELGRGGMGIVYLAREVQLDRLVAIKLLPSALAERPQVRERFLREARMAASLSHPHIVPIYRVGEANGLVFFVMAHVNGETLGERLAAGESDYIDRSVIRPLAAPLQPQGGLVALFGNIAPKGAILKRSAADAKLFEHEGKAVVFSSLADLAARIDDPSLDVTPQDVLVASALSPEALLDLTANFVVFEPEGGRTIKKIARYQQFIAVNRAIQRIRCAPDPAQRGGVVWHTQGAGKSLIMLWLAVKLRRMAALENPTLVVVTDRTDLDQQIHDTFGRCGFPNPHRAGSVRHLRELLSIGTGQGTFLAQPLGLSGPGRRSPYKCWVRFAFDLWPWVFRVRRG